MANFIQRVGCSASKHRRKRQLYLPYSNNFRSLKSLILGVMQKIKKKTNIIKKYSTKI